MSSKSIPSPFMIAIKEFLYGAEVCHWEYTAGNEKQNRTTENRQVQICDRSTLCTLFYLIR